MNGSKDRLLIIKKYRSLSPEARKLVNTETNDRFWTKNKERRNQKLDLNNPADKPFVKEWLQIRDELVSLKDYDWENIASKNREIQQFQQEQGKSLGQEKAINIFGKSDPKEIKSFVQKKMNVYGVDKVKLAINLSNENNTKEIKSLIQTHDGLDAMLLLLGALVTSTDSKAQETINRIINTFSIDSLSPQSISDLHMNQGILRQRDNGKKFLERINTEFINNESIAALNFAKDLTAEHIIVAKNTPEGLKGLIKILKQLATGSYDEKDKNNADAQFKRIFEVLVPGSTGEYKTSAYGILDRYGYGEKLHGHIKNQLSIHGDKAAVNIIKGISNKDLMAVTKNPEGRKGLLSAYNVLITSSEKRAPEQATRILAAFQVLEDPNKTEKRIEEGKIPVFPIKRSFIYGSSPFAKIIEDEDIKIKFSTRVANYELFKNETYTINKANMDVFIHGKNFKPEEIIGFKLYDEGGITIYRPAAYMLHINNESVTASMEKSLEAASFAIPGGVLIKGRVFVKGVASGIEVGLDTAAAMLITSNIAKREHRGWMIKNFGEDGREFVEVWDRASRYAAIYSMGKMIASPLMGKLRTAWKDLKDNSRMVNSTEFKNISNNIDRFISSADDALKKTSAEVRPASSEGPALKVRSEDTIPGVGIPTPKGTIRHVPVKKTATVRDIRNTTLDGATPQTSPKAPKDTIPNKDTLRGVGETNDIAFAKNVEAPKAAKGSKELIGGGHAGTASLKGDGGQTGYLIFNIKEVEKTVLKIEASRIKPQDKPLRGVRPAGSEGSALKARGEDTVKISIPKGSRDMAIEGGQSSTTPLEGETGLSFGENFTQSQIKNWKADHFWKTPEELLKMRGSEGFRVVIDKNTNEVIGAYFDYSKSSLTTGARAENFNNLFESKVDMVVRPDFRKRGIGQTIFQEMIKKAKEYGAENIKVHASNPGSFRWFRRYHPKKIIVDNLGKPPTTTEKPPKPPGDFPPSEMTREGPVAQKGELSTMRGELLIKSDPLKDLLKPRPLKHTDYPGKTPTPTELQKMEANLSKMDLSKEGLVLNDRPHLWKDPKHCKDFLKAMGKPEKFDEISSLPKEMQHQSYNKFIQDSAKDALNKSDTFMYECDYHKLNGDFGGHQVNVEFSSPTGKRIIVSFDKESGQIFNTFDIKRSGEPIGWEKTMDHPTFTFRNREWIKGNDKQWLGSRSEKPIDVVEKKRVDKPQIPAQTEKPEAKLKIRERKDQQKIAERVDQMGSRFG